MSTPVRIPADIDLEDRILGRATARQVAILAATATVVYLAWTTLRPPVPVFLAAAAPVAAAAIVVAVGRRDGVTLDRFLVAAARHFLGSRRPRHHHPPAIPGWLAENAAPQPATPHTPRHPASPVRLPPRAIHRTPASGSQGLGVVDLGGHGLAVVAACTTVPFRLRTPAEQNGLVATFGRYLHSLTSPVQVLVRALPLDLSAQVAALYAAADRLPHPALAAACLDHADWLRELGERHELLRRQVLLVLREPAPPPAPGRGRPAGPAGSRGKNAADARLARRLSEAADLLAPAGISVVGLDADTAAAVLAAATHPGRHHLSPTPPDVLARDADGRDDEDIEDGDNDGVTTGWPA